MGIKPVFQLIKKCIYIIPLFLVLLFNASLIQADQKVIKAHALSMLGTPKYRPDFKHFDYVNPNAPKGGSITYKSIGSYDNFHRYAQRGVAADGSGAIYDSLMVSSEDEISACYGLIAREVEYTNDFTWMIFHLNPKARFQDGKPITSDDVVFSFHKFMKEGVEQFRHYYKDVSEVKALGKYDVRFSMKKSDKEKLISLASGLKILPKHYWESRDFKEPSIEPPLGSSAYRIKDYKIGQYVVYERIKNYWAEALPSKKGLDNFNIKRYDYYRDEAVALEAFKAGEYDIRFENIAKNWATLYTGPNFEKGYIAKEEIEHDIPQGMQALVFNIKKPIFKDPKVREALIYAMDFEWMNKNLFYGQYTRTRSYFQNSEYEAKGLPGKDELKILEPLRGRIPDRVFTEEYNPPVADGSGSIRNNVRKALRLLKKAGWEVKNKALTNVKTGKPFEFELLVYSPSTERIAIPVQNNLKRMGITMKIRQVDTTQFTNRMRKRDYDMISRGYSANYYPDSDLKIIWHSAYLEYTYNAAGVQDPAIDTILEDIEKNQENPKALLSYGRALDRVLQWNFFVIPEWHLSKFRIAYWYKYSRPKIRPKYTTGLSSWWFSVKMGEFRKVFEISPVVSEIQSKMLFQLIISIVILAFGIIWMIRIFLKKQSWTYKSTFGPLFCVFCGAIWLSLTISSLSGSKNEQEPLRESYERGDYEVVEGIVKVHRVQPKSGNVPGDLVSVGGKQFEINYYLKTQAYHQTIEHGGVLQNGIYARVYYKGNDILRVDTMENHNKSKLNVTN